MVESRSVTKTPVADEPAPVRLRLGRIQAELPAIEKTATADGGKYSWEYVPLPELVEVTYPLFSKHDLFLSWRMEYDKLTFYMTCLITNEAESSTFEMPMDETFQDVGKRVTYYTRIAILGFLGMVADVDLGGESSATFRSSPGKAAKATTRGRGRAAVEEEYYEEDEYEEEEEYDEEEYEEPEVEELPRRAGGTRARGRAAAPARGRAAATRSRR